MKKQGKTIIFTRDLLTALIEYMDDENTDALEFDEKNFVAQIRNYNDRLFGRPEDDSPVH